MPDTGDRALLLVVDMQNGFLNEHTAHVVEPVNALIDAFSERGAPVALTRFVNLPGSPYERLIHWSRFQAAPENDLAPSVHAGDHPVFVKHGYTAFTDAFARHLEVLSVARLVLCGVATDGCVLKTAVDAFERGIEPIVVVDACASHGGTEAHDAGLLLLGRFIGKDQLKPLADFV